MIIKICFFPYFSTESISCGFPLESFLLGTSNKYLLLKYIYLYLRIEITILRLYGVMKKH